MPNPTARDLHVDGVRSEISVDYSNDRQFLAGDAIAPILSVDKRSDKYGIWNKADSMRIQMGKVATGSPSPIMERSVSTGSYECEHYKGKTFIADEERANAKGEFELEQANVKFVNDQALLQREKLIADAFFVTGVWDTDKVVTTKWSAGSSTPYQDLRVGCRAIQAATGFWPTDLILGADVEDTLLDHADTIARVSGGARPGDPAIVTLDQIAAILKLKRVTSAAAVYNSASAGVTASMATLYDTNAALLVYRPDTPSKFSPAAAYTFSWQEFDNVSAEAAAIKSWRTDDPDGEWFRGQMCIDPKVVSTASGYFFSAATS
jgi:hypothetical protein